MSLCMLRYVFSNVAFIEIQKALDFFFSGACQNSRSDIYFEMRLEPPKRKQYGAETCGLS